MAFTTDIQDFENSLVSRIHASLTQARMNFAKSREYRKTVNELSALSDRELDDLGLHRSNIAAVARSATDNA